MTRCLALVIALALGPSLAPPPLLAQSQRTAQFEADLERFARETVEMLGLPGLTVTVALGDSTVIARGVGTAEVEAGVPLTARTPVYIASITKPFTALAVARLAERGVVDLDAPVGRYLPDLLPASVEPERVTLRHLLSHSAGLTNDPLVFRTAYTGEHDRGELLDLLAFTAPREGAPLGTFAYTNTGYVIAGQVLEAVTGRPWQDVVVDEVLRPLGMDETTPYVSAAASHPAAPYGAAPPLGVERFYLDKVDATMHAAGGLLSTAEDMGRWLRAQLGHAGDVGAGGAFAEAVGATHVGQAPMGESMGPFRADAYGLGWIVGAMGPDSMLFHFGSFPGSHSMVSFQPENGIGVAVFTNEDATGQRAAGLLTMFVYDWWATAGPGAGAIVGFRRQVAGMAAARRAERGQFLERVTGRASTLTAPLDAYVGTYVDDAYGTLEVSREGAGLRLTLGELTEAAWPGPDPESVVVELRPHRQDGFTFVLGSDDRVVAVQYEDYGRFERAPRR